MGAWLVHAVVGMAECCICMHLVRRSAACVHACMHELMWGLTVRRLLRLRLSCHQLFNTYLPTYLQQKPYKTSMMS